MGLPFSIDELKAAVSAGDVTERPHGVVPLNIYNYSPEVQFSKKWNEVTLNCRGLILDSAYNIVARPWKKFFNLGEVNLGFQFTDPVEVMDKADGSLGILYPDGDGYSVATRGSFQSEQAIRATEIWKTKYEPDMLSASTGLGGDNVFSDTFRGYTYLFEIIYPSNRIVLDYGDMEDLVMLGAVENATGYYVSPMVAAAMSIWPGPVVETYPYKNISDAIANMGRKNKEGYVIRRNNFLVKVKEPDYLDLHRLVTNCSPRTVWEQLRDGKSESEIISAFPDEFHGMVKGFIDPLLEKFDTRFMEIQEGYEVLASKVTRDFEGASTYPSRADFAREFKKHPDAGFFFKMLDNKPIREVLWVSLKPTAA